MCNDGEGYGISLASSQMYGGNLISYWSELRRTRGKISPKYAQCLRQFVKSIDQVYHSMFVSRSLITC